MDEKEIIYNKLTWQKLANPALFNWLQKVSPKEIEKILLKGQELFDLHPRILAKQYQSFKILQKKAPEYCSIAAVVFPEKIFIEQCSSEWTAKNKELLFKELKIKRIVDITGGLGMDAFYLSNSFDYCHIEMNQDLQAMAAHNFKVHGLKIESICGDGMELAKTMAGENTCLYADPMRRDLDNNRSLDWKNHEPNPEELISLAFENGYETVLIKMSPMTPVDDLKLLAGDRNHALIAVELFPELKELLLLISKREIAWLKKAFLQNRNGQLDIIESKTEHEEMYESEGDVKFIFIPGSAINKLDISDEIARQHGLRRLTNKGKMYFADKAENIPGFKCYQVEQEVQPQSKVLKKNYAKGKWNVISKAYPMTANEISSKFKLVPSGKAYLIFVGKESGLACYQCQLL